MPRNFYINSGRRGRMENPKFGTRERFSLSMRTLQDKRKTPVFFPLMLIACGVLIIFILWNINPGVTPDIIP